MGFGNARGVRRPLTVAALLLALSACGGGGSGASMPMPEPNRNPVAVAGPDLSVASGADVILSGAASSDPDGDPLSYAWTQISGAPLALTGASTSALSFTAPMVTAQTLLAFRLTVSDGRGGSRFDEVQVQVAAAVVPTGSLSGRVFNAQDGLPLPGATVLVEGLTQTADANGEFQFNNLPVAERALIEVRTSGFESAFRIANVAENQQTQQILRVLPVGTSAVVMPVIGGTVALPNSAAQVRFPPGAINGSGAVTVTLTDVAPGLSADNMPGDYSALTSDGNPGRMESFGAISVRLFSATGERLNLAPGQTATIRIPLSTRNPSPPSSIPLFFFNESTGLWQQEGTAALLGENGEFFYEGEVAHFTFWNADLIYDTVRISGCVVDANNAPVASAFISSTGGDYTGDSSVFADSQGRFLLPVRRNSVQTVSARTRLDDSLSAVERRSVTTLAQDLDLSGNCFRLAEPNRAPVASLSAVASAISGETILLDGSGSMDPDNGDRISYYRLRRTAGPVVPLPYATPEFLQTQFIAPAVTTPTTLSFLLIVFDTLGAVSSSATVNIQINPPLPPNQPPVANAGPDQTVASGEMVTLNGAASSDPDGSIAQYLWEQTSGPAASLSDAGAAQPQFAAPDVAANTVLRFTLTVTDDDGASASDTVDIQVSPTPPPNQPPQANAGPDQIVTAGGAVVLNGAASNDPDGESLSFSWAQVSGPAVVLVGANTATASFTAPVVEALTTLQFRLTVTDPRGGIDTDEIIVTVAPVNRAPVILISAPSNAIVGQMVALDASASSDPDGDDLTYLWSQVAGSSVVLGGENTAVARFTAPAVTEQTTLRFQLMVDDGREGGTVFQELSISIAPENRAPVANGAAPTNVTAGDMVALDGTSSSDPDGDDLSYSWSQLAGPAVAISGGNTSIASFTAPDVESPTSLRFRLLVMDDRGGMDTQEVEVQVSPTVQENRAPVASIAAPAVVTSGASVDLDGSASSDPDGDTLTYLWTQVAGDPVALSGASTDSASFTAPTVATPSTLRFRLTVHDGRGETAFDEIALDVMPLPVVNRAPRVFINAPAFAEAGQNVELNGGNSNDPNGDTLSFQWTQMEGPVVSLDGADMQSASFVAPNAADGTVLRFRLIADDGQVSARRDATVNLRSPPTGPLFRWGYDHPVRLALGFGFGSDSSLPAVVDGGAKITVGNRVVNDGAAGSVNVRMFAVRVPNPDGEQGVLLSLTTLDNVPANGSELFLQTLDLSALPPGDWSIAGTLETTAGQLQADFLVSTLFRVLGGGEVESCLEDYGHFGTPNTSLQTAIPMFAERASDDLFAEVVHTQNAFFCFAEEDWFSVELLAGQPVAVAISKDANPEFGITLELYDPAQNLIAVNSDALEGVAGAVESRSALIVATPNTTGTHHVRVRRTERQAGRQTHSSFTFVSVTPLAEGSSYLVTGPVTIHRASNDQMVSALNLAMDDNADLIARFTVFNRGPAASAPRDVYFAIQGPSPIYPSEYATGFEVDRGIDVPIPAIPAGGSISVDIPFTPEILATGGLFPSPTGAVTGLRLTAYGRGVGDQAGPSIFPQPAEQTFLAITGFGSLTASSVTPKSATVIPLRPLPRVQGRATRAIPAAGQPAPAGPAAPRRPR